MGRLSMGRLRTGVIALAVSLLAFSTAGHLRAEESLMAETPGQEASDIPVQTDDGDVSSQDAASPEPMPAPLETPTNEPSVGQETGLPLPRYVSMKSNLANIRRGPSKTHRIDWQFTRKGMPVQVVGEYGHWRLIRDHDGMGGWVHYALLSGKRTVLVEDSMLPIRYEPEPDSPMVAKLEQGVIADLGECNKDWCRISVSGYRGWAPKTALWGVGKDEIRK